MQTMTAGAPGFQPPLQPGGPGDGEAGQPAALPLSRHLTLTTERLGREGDAEELQRRQHQLSSH